ncbi:type II toxin-antitoxin system RelE/ParE family toxin [Desulfoferrobacter suflitae]|uniref:type II toxin-antitoxin system RelE/ParE family toxin n=1 Tax=Desulfoferrobacter suflitae TaxID=2865782 RepID=UPI00338F5EFB
MEVAFSASFKRAFSKRIKGQLPLEKLFWERVETFVEDPFDKRLRTHKLSGKLKDLWSFSITYDSRVIFYFADQTRAIFVDIGSHDEVY